MLAAAVVLALTAFSAALVYHNYPGPPFRVGVLLDLTGPQSREPREVLDWTAERVNASGGVAGHRIELVYKDAYNADVKALARELADDPTIRVVVGPGRSVHVADTAPLLIDAKKLIISPTATADRLFRMYSDQGYVWRSCQSDAAQVRSILHVLKERGVKKVALVYEDSLYGQTFVDWLGFYATETDMEVTALEKFASGDPAAAAVRAAESGPEYIVIAAFSEDAVRAARAVKETDGRVELFFTDAAETQYVVDNLEEGAEVMSSAADPDSEFEEAYQERFGHYPWNYAAHMNDALLLSVYALARQEYASGWFRRGEGLDDSIRQVVRGTGKIVPWDKPSEAIREFLAGRLPNITGASGPLTFDVKHGMDPLETYYAHSVLETRDGIKDFWTVERMSSNDSAGLGRLESGASANRTLSSSVFALSEEGTMSVAATSDNLWAVILATSANWENYRHQADALAVYDRLKSNGVSDDRIVLMLVDDIPHLSENPLTGDVHHKSGGKNLRTNAIVDYRDQKVNARNFKKVLFGETTPETPIVLDSMADSRVLLYVVGHAASGRLAFKYGEGLTTDNLAQIIDGMAARKKFEKMLVMVEVCHSRSLGEKIKTPGVLYFTGASESEASFGDEYDYAIKQWLADEFTSNVLDALETDPKISLLRLVAAAFERTVGSHVQLMNFETFGTLNRPATDFFGAADGR